MAADVEAGAEDFLNSPDLRQLWGQWDCTWETTITNTDVTMGLYDGTVPDIPVPPPRLVAVPAARDRAKALLKSILSPSDWKHYKKTGTLIVVGGVTRNIYRLHNDSAAGNIRVLDRLNRETHVLCCHCNHSEQLPIEDQLIAQKLHIEHDETAFLAKANTRQLTFPDPRVPFPIQTRQQRLEAERLDRAQERAQAMDQQRDGDEQERTAEAA
jgi:hypothetical protein